MELEEMKALWTEMSAALEKQKKMTDSFILQMTRRRYQDKISKIWIPEVIGSAGCFITMLYILANFQKLSPWYIMMCGIMAMITLFLLCFLSLKAIRGIRSVNISKVNYKESLLEYSKASTQFIFVQKLNFYLATVLMLVILPVMVMLMGGKDIFKIGYLWIFYTVAWLFFYPFSKWLFKSYSNMMAQAEEILKEIEG